jgi:hypothetical protein
VTTATGGGRGPPPRGDGVAGRPGLMSVTEKPPGEASGALRGAEPSALLSVLAVWMII